MTKYENLCSAYYANRKIVAENRDRIVATIQQIAKGFQSYCESPYEFEVLPTHPGRPKHPPTLSDFENFRKEDKYWAYALKINIARKKGLATHHFALMVHLKIKKGKVQVRIGAKGRSITIEREDDLQTLYDDMYALLLKFIEGNEIDDDKFGNQIGFTA